MQRLTPMGTGILAACLLATLLASSSFGAMTLPNLSTATNWIGVGGKGKVNAVGAEIGCSSNTSDGTVAAGKKEGQYHSHIKECRLGSSTCQTAGDAAGVVLLLGEWHLVLTVVNSSDVRLIWFPIEEISVTCGLINVKLRGGILGQITAGTGETHFKVSVLVKEGKQEFTEYENDTGEKVKLKFEVNAGLGFVNATEELEKDELTSEKATKLEN
jgi:hypothetical protein